MTLFCLKRLFFLPRIMRIIFLSGSIIIQRNWRKFQTLRDWPWQSLLFKIRPLLNTAEKRKEMDELLVEYETMKKELEQETKMRKELEAEHVKLVQKKNKLISEFAGESDAVQDRVLNVVYRFM